jgi:hypothetical protein
MTLSVVASIDSRQTNESTIGIRLTSTARDADLCEIETELESKHLISLGWGDTPLYNSGDVL